MKRLFIPLLIGFALRLALAIFTHGNYDLRSYELVTNIVRAGGNVYAETARYNYTPLWSFVLALPMNIRAFLSVVDILNALLIARIAGDKAGIFYALNPLSILLVGYGGQFENLAALPILLALYHKKGTPLLCALAVIIKHDVVFVAWCALVYRYGWRRAGIVMLSTVAVFLATFLPYREAWSDILHNVFLYQSSPDVYGVGLLHLGSILLLVLTPLVPLAAKHYGFSLWCALLLTILAQFALMPGFGDQYWILLPLFAFEESVWRTAVIWSLAGLVLVLPWNITAELIAWPYVPRLMNAGWLLSVAWFGWLIWKKAIQRKNDPAQDYAVPRLYLSTVGTDIAPERVVIDT